MWVFNLTPKCSLYGFNISPLSIEESSAEIVSGYLSLPFESQNTGILSMKCSENSSESLLSESNIGLTKEI